jgi:hypothetical protein
MTRTHDLDLVTLCCLELHGCGFVEMSSHPKDLAEEGHRLVVLLRVYAYPSDVLDLHRPLLPCL